MAFNIKEVMFIVAAILVIGGGSMYFGSNQQYIGVLIFLPLSVLIFVVYGMRWFGADGIYNLQTTQWPPAINSCPDYLTGYTIKSPSGDVKGCVDRIGVSRNGGLVLLQKGIVITSPNDNRFFPLNAGETRAALCQRVMTAGLTWEGVTDGETCFSADSTGSSVVPGAASNSCTTAGT
jgi:hypothetical protein